MSDGSRRNNKPSDEQNHNPLIYGTPREKVEGWLNLSAQEENGPLRAGDYMSNLIPHIRLHSIAHAQPRVTFSFTVQPDHCNRLGNLHGGAAATLFDFSTTMAILLVNKPDFWVYLGVSRTLNVTYLRPIPHGEEVLIENEVVQIGRRLVTLRGVMKRKQDGVIMAICEHGKFNNDPEPKV
jgi:acyl-coenzyme A thioesterase 13